MFENCTKLEYLNLQNFQITTNAREEDMFKNCNNLKTKIIPEKKKSIRITTRKPLKMFNQKLL